MNRLQHYSITVPQLCYVLVATFLIFGFLPRIIAAVRSEENALPVPAKLPEKYIGNLQLLLEDYRAREIQSGVAIEILILLSLERDGVFLPLDETDTYLDHYYVSRGRHEAVAKIKSQLRQFEKEDSKR